MTDAGPLLVPIRLDAAVVVEKPSPSGSFRRWTMTYDGFAENFASPEPPPFEPTPDFVTEPANWGVYLMWTLPPALRHGTQSPKHPTSGAVHFPRAPNRWLVVRTAVPAQGDPVTASWIVESDFLDPEHGTSPFLDPHSRTPLATCIGRAIPVDADDPPWVEPHSGRKRKTFLSAVGRGDPAFAAYQPGNENVFSIHDRLENVADSTVHYFVAGWHAFPGDDPLHGWAPADKGGGYAGLLERLQWDAPAPDTKTAASCVYHGLLLDVQWKPGAAAPPSARDGARSSAKLALGNTAIEALAAFLQTGPLDPSAPELLEAFALDLLGELQQPGGEEILDRKLHASWFGSAPGGVRWDIVDTPTDPGDRPHEPLADTELAAEEQWLAELNVAQDQLDGLRRLLASKQRELYEVWWKREFANAQPTNPYVARPNFDDELKQLTGEVQSLIGQTTPPPPPTQDVRALDPKAYAASKKLPAERQLVAGLAPRFFAAQDPVLLLSGLAHDMVTDPRARLECRYTDQVLTGPTATVAVPKTSAGGLSPAIAPLLTEFVLLQTHETGTTGTPPPDFVLQPWNQPWLPLYLEWQVKWYALPYGDGWTFDGKDFAWSGTPPDPSEAPYVNGRALLTPGLAFAIRSRLEQMVAGDPELQPVKDQLEAVTAWDFLSQTLAGLTTRLALRDAASARAPDKDLRPLVGDHHPAAPQWIQVVHMSGDEEDTTTFTGLRAGQLALDRISIVDRFGQTLEIIPPTAAAKPPPVFVAAALTPRKPVADGACAELPPRLLQGARLRFAAVSPIDDATELDMAPGVNPICGFLVPDHVGWALAVHGPAGSRLGELRLAAGDTEQVVWDGAPLGAYRAPGDLGTAQPQLAAAAKSSPRLAADLSQAHPQLADVIGAVLTPGTFRSFLATIDETLWTIDPLAGYEDDYLTALAGRPLALVRARLAFELGGEPLRDPSFGQAAPKGDPPFTGYDFPVELGDAADREDGLVGYFLDGDPHTTFHAVRPTAREDHTADPSGFVTQADASDIELRFDSTTERLVSLLVDPRGKVQAHTGLLPTTVLELPRAFLAPALAAIGIAYRAGPLLADEPPAPLMPTASAPGRTWSWTEQDGDTTRSAPFPAVDDRARFPADAATAREGFVQVDPAGGDR